MKCDGCRHFRPAFFECGALLGQVYCSKCDEQYSLEESIACPDCGSIDHLQETDACPAGNRSAFCPGFESRPTNEPAKTKTKKKKPKRPADDAPTLF